MAADDSDDAGVLGNLPRSRPGTRSAKRASGGASAKKPAAKRTPARKATAAGGSAGAKRAKRPAAGTSTASRDAAARKSATSSPGESGTAAPRPQPPRQRREEQQPGDPLSQAVRLAGKVAETGVKTGVGILKRISGR